MCFTTMAFESIKFMQPLPSAEISAETETAMKELVEKFRPVRQRTVRGETTKDKAGALPTAVYTKPPDCSKQGHPTDRFGKLSVRKALDPLQFSKGKFSPRTFLIWEI